MTQELIYYTCTDAHICQKSLQKQGYTATVIPTPLVRSRSTYRGTIEQFRTLLNLAVQNEYESPETKDLLHLELVSLKHILEKITNLLAEFYRTNPVGSILPKTKPAGETAVFCPGEDAGYLDDILKDNGILEPENRTVIAQPSVAECKIERPSFSLETLAPELLEKSGLTVITEHRVEYRFIIRSNADTVTLASCGRCIGTLDPVFCCTNSDAHLQTLRTKVLERIQNTPSNLSVTDISHLLERPIKTAHHEEECYRLPREYLKLLLYELGLFRLD